MLTHSFRPQFDKVLVHYMKNRYISYSTVYHEKYMSMYMYMFVKISSNKLDMNSY